MTLIAALFLTCLIEFVALFPDKVKEVRSQGNRVKLEGLLPASIYTLRVWGENSVGRGPLSVPIRAATHEEAPSSPPRELKVKVIA